MNLYKVGIMSSTAEIMAPSPEAAVVYYGMQCGGNAMFAAVIYEMDGKEYEGNGAPLFDVQLGARKLSEDEVETLNVELPQCKIVEWNE